MLAEFESSLPKGQAGIRVFLSTCTELYNTVLNNDYYYNLGKLANHILNENITSWN